ncbi:MAG: hypothetical protein N2645_02675 [Clostridia bacterium]|nr:hypothetical protein [Clostridia bacterium]
MNNNDRCSGGPNCPYTNDFGNILSSCFFSLPPKQFALLSSLIGILLVDNLDIDQQNSLGNFIVNIGQAILAAAAQGEVIESSKKKNDHLHQQIELLKKQICALEQELQ